MFSLAKSHILVLKQSLLSVEISAMVLDTPRPKLGKGGVPANFGWIECLQDQ